MNTISMKALTIIIATIASLLFTACQENYEHKTVVCIPVYGQSLALGEEAERMTDFDSLAAYADGRIVTENLDHNFGYFDNDHKKQWFKKAIGYKKRAYELSVYKMAQILVDLFGKDTLICIFPGGQGATAIANLSKGTLPYQRFIENIQTAFETSQERGWDFFIPAICWMQGESDIVDYPNTVYQNMLTQIWKDMNDDILRITQQKDSIPFICYQSNSLGRAINFKADTFLCKETEVPQTFVELLLDNPHFWASGPTYPYACVNEKIHIDAKGQQSIGALAAETAFKLIKGENRFRGLIPLRSTICDNVVKIAFNVPNPPLTLDTIQVSKARLYGFSVINDKNKDIAQSIDIDNNSVIILCSESPIGCRIRYAVNGDYMKSGNLHGPRGNLRDSNNHWCYQFDLPSIKIPLSDESESKELSK